MFRHSNGTYAAQSVGALAQLGERLICIQEVSGSIPLGSTNSPLEAKVGKSERLQKRNPI